MANPRQRRKTRSSSYKPVSHSRHAKRNLKKTPPIRGPKALQDAWDKTKTVRQNYAKIGLAVTLDPSATGGVEKPLGVQVTKPSEEVPVASTSTAHDQNATTTTNVPAGFGRIVRDSAGNVLGVEMNEDDDDDKSGRIADRKDDIVMDDVDSKIDQDVRERWATDFSKATASYFGPKDEKLVKDLEHLAAPATGTHTLSIAISGIGSRHTSSGELKYLQPLLQKHGSNIEAMAGDLKLNPEQRTAGQLRRTLKKAGLLT